MSDEPEEHNMYTKKARSLKQITVESLPEILYTSFIIKVYRIMIFILEFVKNIKWTLSSLNKMVFLIH